MWKAIVEALKSVASYAKLGAKQVVKGVKQLTIKRQLRGVQRIINGVNKIKSSPYQAILPIQEKLLSLKHKILGKKISDIIDKVGDIKKLGTNFKLDTKLVNKLKKILPEYWNELNRLDDIQELKEQRQDLKDRMVGAEIRESNKWEVFEKTMEKLEKEDKEKQVRDNFELDFDNLDKDLDNDFDFELDITGEQAYQEIKEEAKNHTLDYKEFLDKYENIEIGEDDYAYKLYMKQLLKGLDNEKAQEVYQMWYRRGYIDVFGNILGYDSDFRNKKIHIYSYTNKWIKDKYSLRNFEYMNLDIDATISKLGILQDEDLWGGEDDFNYSTMSEQERIEFWEQLAEVGARKRNLDELDSKYFGIGNEIYNNLESLGYSQARIRSWIYDKISERKYVLGKKNKARMFWDNFKKYSKQDQDIIMRNKKELYEEEDWELDID